MSRIRPREYDRSLSEEYLQRQERADAQRLAQLDQLGQINASGISQMGDVLANGVQGVTSGYLRGSQAARENEAHQQRMKLSEEALMKDKAERDYLDQADESGVSRRRRLDDLKFKSAENEAAMSEEKLRALREGKPPAQMTPYQQELLSLRAKQLELDRIKAQRSSASESKPQLVTYTDADGKTVQEFVQPKVGEKFTGKPTATKDPNASALAAAGYADRANAASMGYDELTKTYDPTSVKSGIQAAISSVPVLGAIAPDQDSRKAKQFKNDFITSVLRKESGASISPGEYQTADEIYFPQPGDGPEIVAQKAVARQRKIEGLKAEAGSATVKETPAAVVATPPVSGAAYAAPSKKAPEEMTNEELAAELAGAKK